jgi:hypothetical protein
MLMTSAYCNADDISLLQCCCHQLTVIMMKSAYCNTYDLLLHTVPDSPPGVYLYLGYSRIDAEVLKQGRMKLNDEVGTSCYHFQPVCHVFIYSTMNHLPLLRFFCVGGVWIVNPGLLKRCNRLPLGYIYIMPICLDEEKGFF